MLNAQRPLVVHKFCFFRFLLFLILTFILPRTPFSTAISPTLFNFFKVLEGVCFVGFKNGSLLPMEMDTNHTSSVYCQLP
jgi:hypothetical protein